VTGIERVIRYLGHTNPPAESFSWHPPFGRVAQADEVAPSYVVAICLYANMTGRVAVVKGNPLATGHFRRGLRVLDTGFPGHEPPTPHPLGPGYTRYSAILQGTD
jgi:hypothetical protein